MYKRYSVVLRHFEGFSNRRIAEMEGIGEHAVGKYIKNYKLNGLDGFEEKKNWTIEIIRQWVIKEFSVEMCHSGMVVVLHRLNLSYTRPTVRMQGLN